MENTGKVLFEDPSPQWFVALGKSWVGPLTASDVHAKVIRQEVSWAHFIWRKGQKNWQRICETEPFKAAVPHEPSKAVKDEVHERSREIGVKAASARKGPPPPPKSPGGEDVDRKIWYLYFNETQFGPFSMSEVEEYISAGKVNARVYVWKDGMSGWERLEKVDPFQKKFKQASPMIQPAGPRSGKAAKQADADADKRGAPRKPMVARIILSNDREVAVALCRDISVGGMQVLTDQIPGEVGAQIKLNVSPVAETKGEKKPEFKAFVAEGMIVRLLEDGRGFSFRFSRLTDSARRSIETYIQTKAS